MILGVSWCDTAVLVYLRAGAAPLVIMTVAGSIVIIGACAVPAFALSLIPAAVPGSAERVVAGGDVPADLLAALGRCAIRGLDGACGTSWLRCSGLAVCAVLAGARSYVAIAEWGHDLPDLVRSQCRR